MQARFKEVGGDTGNLGPDLINRRNKGSLREVDLRSGALHRLSGELLKGRDGMRAHERFHNELPPFAATERKRENRTREVFKGSEAREAESGDERETRG